MNHLGCSWLRPRRVDWGQLVVLCAALQLGTASARAAEGVAAGSAAASADYGESFTQLDMLGVPALHACGLTGKGVIVAVLDSGFNLQHRVFATLDVAAEYDFVQDDAETADQPGDPIGQAVHGTKVLAVLAGKDPGVFSGVAPGVTVLLAKIDAIDEDSAREDDWWVQGLEWARAHGADIVTTSINYCGSGNPCSADLLDGMSEPTTIAAVSAAQNGLLIVSSAGNEGPAETTIRGPGDGDGVLSIGAVDFSGTVAPFSSRGPTWDGRIKPDLVAPGSNILVVNASTTDQYERSSGTSLAAPLAAGVAALLKEAFPSMTAAELRTLLKTTANGSDSPDNSYGWGLIDGVKAAGLRCSCTDEDGDGFYDKTCGGDDCDDGNASIHPGATEICNGADDDCDGAIPPAEADDDNDGQPDCTQTAGQPDAGADAGSGGPKPPNSGGGCGIGRAHGSDAQSFVMVFLLLLLRRRRRDVIRSVAGDRRPQAKYAENTTDESRLDQAFDSTFDRS